MCECLNCSEQNECEYGKRKMLTPEQLLLRNYNLTPSRNDDILKLSKDLIHRCPTCKQEATFEEWDQSTKAVTEKERFLPIVVATDCSSECFNNLFKCPKCGGVVPFKKIWEEDKLCHHCGNYENCTYYKSQSILYKCCYYSPHPEEVPEELECPTCGEPTENWICYDARKRFHKWHCKTCGEFKVPIDKEAADKLRKDGEYDG